MLRIGIIGSGFGLYGHLPAFYSIKNCSVVSVCANNQERLSKHYYSLGLQNVYSDWRQMLRKEDLDAITIAVTPQAQYEIAKAAIEKGIHVFAEKPLADTYKHAKILCDLALKHKVTHAVDFIFPEINEWKQVKQLLEQKTYGKLKHISINWDFLSHDVKNRLISWKLDPSIGAGALSFYFSHSLYYLEYFAGEIDSVKSSLYFEKDTKNQETGVDLLLHFKNNIQGQAHISCSTIGLSRHQLIFLCEKGTIILENQNSYVRNFHITIYTKNGKKSIHFKKEDDDNDDQKARVGVVKQIAERFVFACVQKKQMKPSMKEGMRVQQLIEKIKA